MQTKIIRYFTNAAGVLLLGMGTSLLIANWASFGLVQPRDPVLQISMRTLFWVTGAGELGVATVCLFGRQAWLKLGLVSWLTTILVAYIGCFLSGTAHHNFSFYLASLGRAFAITPGATYLLVRVVVAALWLGSATSMFWLWLGNRGCLKCACVHCGEHISFPVEGVGRQISCPHCAAKTVLRAPAEAPPAAAKPSATSP